MPACPPGSLTIMHQKGNLLHARDPQQRIQGKNKRSDDTCCSCIALTSTCPMQKRRRVINRYPHPSRYYRSFSPAPAVIVQPRLANTSSLFFFLPFFRASSLALFLLRSSFFFCCSSLPVFMTVQFFVPFGAAPRLKFSQRLFDFCLK